MREYKLAFIRRSSGYIVVRANSLNEAIQKIESQEIQIEKEDEKLVEVGVIE